MSATVARDDASNAHYYRPPTDSRHPFPTCLLADAPPPPVFDPLLLPTSAIEAHKKLFSAADYAEAVALATAGLPHRTMRFGRRGGQWVINGET
jgi:hypothetical protein